MKIAFALVVLMVTPTMAFAQGTIGWANNSLEMQWTSVTDHTLIPVPVGGGQFELFVAPNGTPFTPLGTYVVQNMVLYFIPDYSSLSGFLGANPGWSAIATTGIGPLPGRFNGGNVALPGIAGGATAECVIIGWTGSAPSLDMALLTAGLMGSSPMLTTATGNPTTTPPGTPVLLSATITLAPIPEPPTFALTGLGIVTLMIYRRRR